MNKSINGNYIWMILRILISLMFVESFIDKLMHWELYINEINAKAIPFPILSLAIAMLVEGLGAITLLTGLGITYGAILLAGYVFVINFVYFDFWNQSGIASIISRKEFFKDLAVIAALAQIVFINFNKSFHPISRNT